MSRNILPKDLLPKTSSRKDIIAKGHLPKDILQKDILPKTLFNNYLFNMFGGSGMCHIDKNPLMEVALRGGATLGPGGAMAPPLDELAPSLVGPAYGLVWGPEAPN